MILDRRNIQDFMGHCEDCGKYDELRPYGENKKKICYDCGKKNPNLTEKMMSLHFAEEEQRQIDNN